MIGIIEKTIMDLLYSNAAVLCAGGNEFAAGWIGVTREKYAESETAMGVPITNGAMPLAGYINLFDRPYSKDSDQARPGIYVGTTGMESSDGMEFNAVSGTGSDSNKLVDYRLLRLPLFMAVSDQDYYTVRGMRNQLRFNVKKILFNHQVETYWWNLQMPGRAGGEQWEEKAWCTSSGLQEQGMSEGYDLLPVAIHYQFSMMTTQA